MSVFNKLAVFVFPLLSCSATMHLHEAVQSCDIGTVKLLISSGAPVNELDSALNTPLHMAVRAGKPACVLLLLAAGANPFPPNRSGQKPHLLARRYPDGVVRGEMLFLLERLDLFQGGPNPIQEAISYAILRGEYNIVKVLLDVGGDPNGMDGRGSTPLHHAAMRGNLPVVEALLEHGGVTGIIDRDGFLPLHLAALSGAPDVISLLVKHGANMSAVTRDSRESALHIAAAWGRLEAVRALVALGADKLAKDGKGRTPIDRAMEGDFREVVRILQASK